MFKEYEANNQQSLFNSDMWMDERTKKRLENSWAPVFNEHIYKMIDERPFEALYNEKTGAPNFPVRILLSLEIIKHMQDISDSELFEKYDFDYLVNYALGQRALGEKPMAERTLYYFRERLYLYTMKNLEGNDLINEQFKWLTQGLTINAGPYTDKQRVDTTQIMSNIKKAGRVSLAYDVLVKVAKKIPKEKRTGEEEALLSPTFKQETKYKAKSSETESKLTILLRHCQAVLKRLEGMPEAGAEDETRILKRLLAEQGIENENGEACAKDGKKVSPKSLQSAHDEEATYRKKGEAGHTGYVAGITETCSEENPFQAITDYTVEQNVASDIEILHSRLGHISEAGCETLYADGGFSAGGIIEEAASQGIEMQYTNMACNASGEGKLGIDSFILNETLDTIVQCPAGNAPIKTSVAEKSTGANFDIGSCKQCPYFDQCPARPQKNSFAVRMSYDQIALSERRKAFIGNFKENTGMRAAIEGTNSALKRKGMGKLRVRGIVKCTIVVGYKILAQNIKRFVKYTQGFYDKKIQSTFAPSATE